jgi:GT2 family glycosyltransferase
VDNGSRLQASAELQRRWGEQPGLRGTWLDGDGPFNWSLLNNRSALEAKGELLLFLNNDVQLCAASGRNGSWLESLAAQALRPAVATAGALLLTPEGMIQHAGIVTGLGGDGCAHPYRNLPPGHGVHRGRSSFLTAWPALTGACLMVRRLLFLEAGGFDPALPVEGNDVDFGLRLGARGFRQVLCPEAVLMHAEGSSRRSRGDDQPTRHAGLNLLRQRWPQQLAGPGPFWPAACSSAHPDGRPRELAFPDLD